MALSTYTELKASVADWLNRSDLTSRIPDFITLAEKRIARRLKSKGNMGRATTSFVTSQEYYTLPDDFIEARNVHITISGGVKPLKYRTPEQLDTEYPSTTTGTPAAYTIFGNEMQIRPIPDSARTLEIAYFKKLDELSEGNQTNWTLTNAPDLLLYGALIEAKPFLKDDNRIKIWQSLFETGINELNEQERRGRYSGSVPVVRTDTQNP